jgi:hypothetical protein
MGREIRYNGFVSCQPARFAAQFCRALWRKSSLGSCRVRPGLLPEGAASLLPVRSCAASATASEPVPMPLIPEDPLSLSQQPV